jgi:hypothetical protein
MSINSSFERKIYVSFGCAGTRVRTGLLNVDSSVADPDPNPDPLVRGMDPDPDPALDPDPSIIKKI